MPLAVRGLAPLLQIFDMPTSIRFYRDVLGFEVVETSQPTAPGDCFHWALLSHGGVELMLNTAYEDDDRPPAPDPARAAAHADTAIFFGCPDVDGAYEHLRAQDVRVDAPTLTSYGFKGFSVADPDGYQLCFHWPATEEALEGWRTRYGVDSEGGKHLRRP